MRHRNEAHVSREDRFSYVKEAWEGGIIALVSLFLPLAVGIVDMISGFSTVPIPRGVMISIGAVIAAIGMIPFILSFGVATKESSELVTHGIYAHIRHPHYLSNMIWGFSFAFFFGSLGSFSVFIISLLPVYYLIRTEEKKLIRKYGEEYKQYIEQVPMFLPRIEVKRRG